MPNATSSPPIYRREGPFSTLLIYICSPKPEFQANAGDPEPGLYCKERDNIEVLRRRKLHVEERPQFEETKADGA